MNELNQGCEKTLGEKIITTFFDETHKIQSKVARPYDVRISSYLSNFSVEKIIRTRILHDKRYKVLHNYASNLCK